MKLLKRITAVMAALLIVVNITVVNIFAVSAAPVAAGGFILFLTALLAAGGHSQLEIDSMSVGQMQSTVVSDFDTGRITRDTIVTDPFTNENIKAMDYLCYHEFYDFRDNVNSTVNSAVNGFIDSIVSVVDGEVKLNEDYFMAMSSLDMYGYGACFSLTYAGDLQYRYCQYIVIDLEKNKFTTYSPCQSLTFFKSGPSWGSVSNTTVNMSLKSEYKFYGDVRYVDGTEAPTDDEYMTVLGETADGTKVTSDMLNPDGSVTIGGVTYYPADYLDPDKLTDIGKDALLAALLNALANTYVKSEDKPIVDEDDITVEFAEELENFTVPTGIISVFPFCLPFDFVRGMKLFSAKPVTPHFEVTIDVPAILNIPPQKWTLEIDLEQFETLAKITRWTSLIGFSYLLISLSTKIVKGAGA